MMTDITAIVIGRPKPYIFVSQKVRMTSVTIYLSDVVLVRLTLLW